MNFVNKCNIIIMLKFNLCLLKGRKVMGKKIKKTRKPVRRIPEEDLDKTRKYKIKKKKHSKLRKTIKITFLVILLFVIIAAGIIIGEGRAGTC